MSFFSTYLDTLRNKAERENVVGYIGVILIIYSHRIIPLHDYILMITVLICAGLGCVSEANKTIKNNLNERKSLKAKLTKSNESDLLDRLNKIEIFPNTRYEKTMIYISYMAWGVLMYATPVAITFIILNFISISIDPLRQISLIEEKVSPVEQEWVLSSSALNSIKGQGVLGVEVLSFEELTKLSVENIPSPFE